MILQLDKAVYPKMALLKTAFHFTDSVYLHLQQDEYNWIVEWVPKDARAELNPKQFENELIAQTLREAVNSETMDLRRMILARAMASTLLEKDPSSVETSTNVVTNPERILMGWFDRYE